MNPTSLKKRLELRRKEVDSALRRLLPKGAAVPTVLRRAMAYSLNGGGKRLRPALLLEACAAVGGDPHCALPAACAMELIHTYSLIHDDLPCMDNADQRRGQPTSHRVFGEANAVLCGDGLLTLAFEVLATQQTKRLPPGVALEATGIIAAAAGGAGMVGGQVLDLEFMAQDVGAKELRRLHRMKTGALLRASVEAGAVIGGATLKQREALRSYGEAVGLAFQIVDDLLDVEGDPALLGKSTQDAAQGKLTFPRVFGVARSRQLAQRAAEQAIAALAPIGDRSETLSELARYLVQRQN